MKVRAKITLIATEQGGRDQPLRGEFRPNHNFGSAEELQMDIGIVELADDQLLHPGQSVECTINFIERSGLDDILKAGRCWLIQEGRRVIGSGVVLDRID